MRAAQPLPAINSNSKGRVRAFLVTDITLQQPPCVGQDGGILRGVGNPARTIANQPHTSLRWDYCRFSGAGLPNFASSTGTFVLISLSTIESRPSSQAKVMRNGSLIPFTSR